MKFLLGLGVGLIVGLLSAPAPGYETREKLLQKLRDLRQLPEEKAEEFADAAAERAGEVGSKVGRKAAEAAVEAVRQDMLGERNAG